MSDTGPANRLLNPSVRATIYGALVLLFLYRQFTRMRA